MEYQKTPRSSRPCLVCGHLYASHIDVACIKVISKIPRQECDCRGFVGSVLELEILMTRRKNTQILTLIKEN